MATSKTTRVNSAVIVMVVTLIFGVVLTQGYAKQWVAEATSLVNSIQNHSAQALAQKGESK
jgi:hypothetical protein